MLGEVVAGPAFRGLLAWEAEDAILIGGPLIANTIPGANGRGYVDFQDAEEETVSWTVEVAQTGRYTIGFRYALAAARNLDGRPLQLSLNGAAVGDLPFLPSGPRYTDWTTLWTEVVLPAGSVTISLETTGASGANLDQLLIDSAPVQVLNTAPTVAGSIARLTLTAGDQAVLFGATLADPDIADAVTAVVTLADGAALPAFLRFDAATMTLSATDGARSGNYALLLRANDGQATSAAVVGFTVAVRSLTTQIAPDLDGDGIRNRRDADDDNDGLSDVVDPFLADASNGRAIRIDAGTRFVLGFDGVPAGAPAGWGFGLTGLPVDGISTAEARGFRTAAIRLVDGALHLGAAAGSTIGAQFGVDPNVRHLTISVLLDNPYDTQVATSGQAFGMVIGAGDQTDYLRLTMQGTAAGGAVLALDAMRGGLAWRGAAATYRADTAALGQADAGDTLRLTLDLDTVTGLLRPSWEVETATGTVVGIGAAITLTGDLLAAIRANGATGLAIGVTTDAGADAPFDIDVLEISVEGTAGQGDIALTGLDSSLSTERLVFNYIEDPFQNKWTPLREYKDAGTVHIANTGDGVLHIAGLELDGPFKFARPADAGPIDLAAGASLDVQVLFDRAAFDAPERQSGITFDGALRVRSDDPNEAVATMDLAGWWQTMPEAGREPTLNEMFRILGLNLQADVAILGNGGLWEKSAPQEVLAPYWKIAPGYAQATVVQLAGFHDAGIGTLFVQAPGVKESVKTIEQQDDLYNQSFFPLVSNGRIGRVAFTNDRVPDEWAGDDVFGFRISGNSSDPTLNRSPSHGTIRGHFIRIFEVEDDNGVAIPETYVLACDLNGVNLDYNDLVYLVQGVTPDLDRLIG